MTSLPSTPERFSETAAAPNAPETWPVLNVTERRVLGVLVEKAKTTPDIYPLSVNALVAGCNQKSNRDPMLNLTEAGVEDGLSACQKKGLAVKITGGRVVRWRHTLYESFRVNKVELAVLAELLLRGPQTEGELRGRASRMEPIDDLDALRPVLQRLSERGLVTYLSPAGRRGTVLTHGFHAPIEMEHLRSNRSAEPLIPPASAESISVDPSAHQTASSIRPTAATHSAIESEVAELSATVSRMQADLRASEARQEELHGELQQLRDQIADLQSRSG